MSEHPALEAARRVDANSDRAIKLKTCRALVRESARRVALVAFGCSVEGVEEIEFADRLETALHDYLRARTSQEAGRAYLGVTAGMTQITDHADTLASGGEG